jgi:hypothetical protein
MSTSINTSKVLGSTSGTSIGIGGDVISPIVSLFQLRVATDGGTFEAVACLTAQLTVLNNIA